MTIPPPHHLSRQAGWIAPLLTGCLLLLSAAPASAQVGGNAPARKGVPIGFAFKPVTFSIDFDTMVSKYQKENAGSRFLETESVARLSSGWQIGPNGKFVQALGAGEEHSIPFADSSIKLLRNGETYFAKIESGSPAFSDPGGLILTFSGIYELRLLEGTWEQYETGGNLKATIAAKDQERYLADLAKMYRDPEFLKWHSTQYKERLLKEFENKSAAGEASAVAKERAVLQSAVVDVTPDFPSTPDVFEVQDGTTLIATRQRSKLTLLYRVTLPAPVLPVP